jgi:hypothetical protein
MNATEALCKMSRLYFNYFQSERQLWHNPHPEFGLNVMPEDLSRFPTVPYNAVAFPMDTTEQSAYTKESEGTSPNKKLKLHAEFKGPPNGELLICTVDPMKKDASSLKTCIKAADLNIEKDGDLNHSVRLLGDIETVKVKFNEEGYSISEWDGGIIELTINDADIWSHGIYASWQFWQWQYSVDEGKTWEIVGGQLYRGISMHRIFIIKDVSTWPWTGYDEEIKDVDGDYYVSQPPFLGALEWACKWAEGETTVQGITSKIVSKLYDSNRFNYPIQGAMNYTSFYNNYFDCGRFIDRLNDKYGRGPNVNCVDCAHMVVALANALGCGLKTGKIENPTTSDGTTFPFKLNPVTLIGWNELAPADHEFAYHQIAFKPSEDGASMDNVFDACIKFDKETYLKVVNMKPEGEPIDLLTPEMEKGHPVDIPIGTDVFTYGYMAILARSLEEASQKDLSMNKGDELTFSISALKFY